jgi:predicted kinase
MLIIIRGAPGSGKTTLARQIQAGDRHQQEIFEADDYFIGDEGYQFDTRKLPEAHEDCRVRARRWLDRGGTALVSNTFTQRWEYQPYIDMAYELGVPYQVIDVHGSFDNVHGVPDEKVKQMRDRFEPHKERL